MYIQSKGCRGGDQLKNSQQQQPQDYLFSRFKKKKDGYSKSYLDTFLQNVAHNFILIGSET